MVWHHYKMMSVSSLQIVIGIASINSEGMGRVESFTKVYVNWANVRLIAWEIEKRLKISDSRNWNRVIACVELGTEDLMFAQCLMLMIWEICVRLSKYFLEERMICDNFKLKYFPEFCHNTVLTFPNNVSELILMQMVGWERFLKKSGLEFASLLHINVWRHRPSCFRRVSEQGRQMRKAQLSLHTAHCQHLVLSNHTKHFTSIQRGLSDDPSQTYLSCTASGVITFFAIYLRLQRKEL